MSAEDFRDSSKEFALKTLDSFDWQDQLKKERAAMMKNEDSCPAGMGFIHRDGPIFHVMPRGEGLFDVHYMFTEPRKFLFFTFSKRLTEELYGTSSEIVKSMIDAHYSGKHDQVRSMMMS